MKHVLVFLFVCAAAAAAKKPEAPPPNSLDAFLQEALKNTGAEQGASQGSLWSAESARFGDLAMDLRARRVGDLVTIVVEERASAVSRGSVSASRQASANAGVEAALGPRTTGWLPNLAGLSSNRRLNGQGETVRETVLNTVLSARVTHVLPNGNLVVEGAKSVTVNAETQRVVVRGVVRPFDLTTTNAVSSDRVSMLEVSVVGRGVIGDAVRQPNILYRILLGLLPF